MNSRIVKIFIILFAVLILLLFGVFIYQKIQQPLPARPLANEDVSQEKIPRGHTNPYVKKQIFDQGLGVLADVLEILLIKDSDGDGLPDSTEERLGRNSRVNDFEIVGFDTDSDKLIDSEEEKIGTDPKNQDTDDDDLSDWAELVIYGTDPLKQDTDGNGLIDSQEPTVLSIQSQIKNMRDSDRDGLVDGKEQELGTDPNKRDTDGDGLLDGPEVILNKDPLASDYDPASPDADGDGLFDSDEERLGTDSQNRDSDGDGLLDYEEVMLYQSDPSNADTDGDGYNDGTEVKNGYDPSGPGKLPELPAYIRFTS